MDVDVPNELSIYADALDFARKGRVVSSRGSGAAPAPYVDNIKHDTDRSGNVELGVIMDKDGASLKSSADGVAGLISGDTGTSNVYGIRSYTSSGILVLSTEHLEAYANERRGKDAPYAPMAGTPVAQLVTDVQNYRIVQSLFAPKPKQKRTNVDIAGQSISQDTQLRFLSFLLEQRNTISDIVVFHSDHVAFHIGGFHTSHTPYASANIIQTTSSETTKRDLHKQLDDAIGMLVELRIMDVASRSFSGRTYTVDGPNGPMGFRDAVASAVAHAMTQNTRNYSIARRNSGEEDLYESDPFNSHIYSPSVVDFFGAIERDDVAQFTQDPMRTALGDLFSSVVVA